MNCIRCGREIPEGEMLCSVCKLPPVTVLPDEAQPAPSKKQRGAKDPKQKKKKREASPKVVRRLSLALFIAVALLLACAAALYFRYDSYTERVDDLRVREASVALREKEADNRDNQISDLTQERDKLKAELEELKKLLPTS